MANELKINSNGTLLFSTINDELFFDSAAAVAPTPDLGWYKFLGNFNDSSGRGKTLIKAGTVNYTAGPVTGTSGITANFTNLNNLYNDTFLDDNLGTDDFSISVWFSQVTPSSQLYSPVIVMLGDATIGKFVEVVANDMMVFLSF